MSNRSVFFLPATLFLLVASAQLRAETPPISVDAAKNPSIAMPMSGTDSISSLNTQTAANAGAGNSAVEAIPTPTALTGGLVILAILIAFRIFCKIQST